MKTFKLIKLFSLALFLTITGCSDDDSAKAGTSRISVKLMDNPGDFENVFIDIVDVMIKVNDNSGEDEGWESINAINTGVYDLLELTGGVNVVLADDYEVPSGTLNQIRLVLGNDNSVVIDGETFPLNTPSAQQSGLKIQVNETLEPNFEYTFLLDFDVNQSIVVAGNSGNINLKPVIRATAEVSTGTISGQIFPSTEQTMITASSGEILVSTYADSNGDFLLVGLTEGFYEVLIVPDPESGFSEIVITDVEVLVGQNTDLELINLD